MGGNTSVDRIPFDPGRQVIKNALSRLPRRSTGLLIHTACGRAACYKLDRAYLKSIDAADLDQKLPPFRVIFS